MWECDSVRKVRELINKSLLVAFGFLAVLGCGVRGNPLPPVEPALIGNGTMSKKSESLRAEDASLKKPKAPAEGDSEPSGN